MKITAKIQAYTLTPKTKIYPERWEEISINDVEDYIGFGQQTKYKLSIVACDYGDNPLDVVLSTRDIPEIKKGTCYNIAFMDNVFQYNGTNGDIVCLNKVITI